MVRKLELMIQLNLIMYHYISVWVASRFAFHWLEYHGSKNFYRCLSLELARPKYYLMMKDDRWRIHTTSKKLILKKKILKITLSRLLFYGNFWHVTNLMNPKTSHCKKNKMCVTLKNVLPFMCYLLKLWKICQISWKLYCTHSFPPPPPHISQWILGSLKDGPNFDFFNFLNFTTKFGTKFATFREKLREI